jgi:predicted nucleotidyltransferase
LHNGHAYHYAEAKRLSGADAVIAVMSGPFVQRGEPAVVGKWARAEMALAMGCDLVIELPVAFAAQPAEWFAYGAVSALEATGVTDTLVFGSESGDLGRLERLAERLYEEPEEFRDLLRTQLIRGISYPAAYAAATAAYAANSGGGGGGSGDSSGSGEGEGCNGDGQGDGSHRRDGHNSDSGKGESRSRSGVFGGRSGDSGGGEGLVVQPNDILGLHYCLALRRLHSRITPLVITRQGAGYHQRDADAGGFASATAIRRLLISGGSGTQAAGGAAAADMSRRAAGLDAARPYMPAFAAAILEREWLAGRGPIDWERFAAPLIHTIISRTPEELAGYFEVTEGLEHRLKGTLPKLDYEEGALVSQLLTALKTKRYTAAKLQRTLLRILLNHSKADLSRDVLSQGVPYLRILGFSAKGQQLLKQMKTTAKVPVVIKATRESSPLLELDIRAAALYALSHPVQESRELYRDYYQSPLQAHAAE